MFAAAAAASAAGCACPHLAALDKHGFRGLLRRRFCSRDDDGDSAHGDSAYGDSACGDGQKHELSDNFVSTTVAGIARASASVHHKAKGSDLSGGKRTNMLLHCEACAGLDGGRNRDALARVRARARASQIGGLCTSDLWVCMHCALCLDREHALAHAAALAQMPSFHFVPRRARLLLGVPRLPVPAGAWRQPSVVRVSGSDRVRVASRVRPYAVVVAFD